MSWGRLDTIAARKAAHTAARKVAPVALTVALVTITPLVIGSTPPVPGPSAALRGAASQPATPPYNACTRNTQFYAANPLGRVLDDTYTWATYPPTKVGNGHGNINWALNPYGRVSWSMWLHSLRWLGAALDAANRGDQRATTHLLAVVRDWSKDNPYPWNTTATAQESTMHRTNVLLCLRTVLSNRDNGTLPHDVRWLDGVIMTHARSLETYFSGYGNHGADESLAMLGVGCLLRQSHYRDLAGGRLLKILDHAIAPDGSVNEQSIGYAAFNYSLWNRTRLMVAQCTPQSPLAATIDTRLSALAGFLAHAMTPLGTFHQLGDTEDLQRPPLIGTPHEYPATAGKTGTPPAQRVAVYRSGYVFGRSGWGTPSKPYPAQSAYSIRFGPRTDRSQPARHPRHDVGQDHRADQVADQRRPPERRLLPAARRPWRRDGAGPRRAGALRPRPGAGRRPSLDQAPRHVRATVAPRAEHDGRHRQVRRHRLVRRPGGAYDVPSAALPGCPSATSQATGQHGFDAAGPGLVVAHDLHQTACPGGLDGPTRHRHDHADGRGARSRWYDGARERGAGHR